MMVTPVKPGIFPMNYKRPKYLVSVQWDKTTIINSETGERKEFSNSAEAWEWKAKNE